MNDPQIAAALRARSPGALAELIDAYGDQLFRYCWGMLRNREIAQIALRDTLVVAQAHIARLSDPGSLGSWLYFLARAECRRRRPVPAPDADEMPARPSQPDADSRLMAWNAAMSMDAGHFEALDLACRHAVDLGPVLGLTAADACALVDRAREELERALSAEILVGRASHACPKRAEVMTGWSGVVTPEIRDRLLRHAADCPVCGPKQPRNVSAARVFALLPSPALPPGARDEILDFAGDESHAAYRELAVERTASLAASGFPAVAETAAAANVTPDPESPDPESPDPESPDPEATRHESAVTAPEATRHESAVAAPEATRQEPEAATREPEAAEPGPELAEPAKLAAILEPTAPVPASELLAAPDDGTPADRLAATTEPTPQPAASPPHTPAQPPVPAQPAVPALETLPAPPPEQRHRKFQKTRRPHETRRTQETRRPHGSPSAPAAPGAKPGRRSSRTGLVVGLAGAMASAAIVGSTLALNAPVTTSARDVNRTVTATGSPVGAVIGQPTSLGNGGALTTAVPPGRAAGRTPPVKSLSRVEPVSPPLLNTPGTGAETLITQATRPSGHAPAPRPGPAAAPAKLTSKPRPGTVAPSAGTLDVATQDLDLGAGSSGQVTLAAVGGPVSWSATASPAQLVSLSESSGTLASGQSVMVTVTVNRGVGAGSAEVSFTPPASAPQAVPVTWSAESSGTGSGPDREAISGGGGTGPGASSNSARAGHYGTPATSGTSAPSGTSASSGGPLRRRPGGTAPGDAPPSSASRR